MPDDAIERAAVEIATRMVPGRFGDDGKRYMSLRQADDWTVAKRAALLAFASQQAKEGWRLVPIKPTPEMTDAARTAFLHDMRGRKLLKYLFEEDPSNVGAYGDVDAPIDVEIQSECAGENAAKVWSAMLDAAPSVTLGEVG